MGLEDLTSIVNDFMGDILENINDAIVDIGEFSKNAIEELGDKGIEALENGDIKRAIECSDLFKENKELANTIEESFKPNCSALLESGAKIVVGALGTAAALATPGFQPAGLAAGASLICGMKDLASQLGSKNANALASI